MQDKDKKLLKIWILKDGEQLPLVEGSKSMRSWRLGEELSKRGHEVTWWSSNFNHMKKERVCEGDYDYSISNNFTLKLLEAGSYRKNLSLARIKHHKKLGERYKSESRKMLKPDVIVASHPIIEFSYEAAKYGKENNVPIIIDIRDMWPDTFQDYFPKVFSPYIKASTFFMRERARYAFSNATAVVSISDDMIKWALNICKIKSFTNSAIFFHSCNKIHDKEIISSKILDIKKKHEGKIIISFIGTFGQTYDLKTICEAARLVKNKYPDLILILAGDGEIFEDIKNISDDEENILLTGWLNHEECKDLMYLTDIGLISITNQTIPNKFGEFLSAGKPILSSGWGMSVELIETYKVGLSYQSKSVSSFLNTLDALLKDNFYQSLGQNCERLFDLKFNAENVYRDYADYIEEITSSSQNQLL